MWLLFWANYNHAFQYINRSGQQQNGGYQSSGYGTDQVSGYGSDEDNKGDIAKVIIEWIYTYLSKWCIIFIYTHVVYT